MDIKLNCEFCGKQYIYTPHGCGCNGRKLYEENKKRENQMLLQNQQRLEIEKARYELDKKQYNKIESLEISNTTTKPYCIDPSASIEARMKRGMIFLEDSEWVRAEAYFESILDLNPEYAPAYIGKLCVELKIRNDVSLKNYFKPINTMSNYKKALRFANNEYKKNIENINKAIVDRINNNLMKEQKKQTKQNEERIAAEKRRNEIYFHNEQKEICKSKQELSILQNEHINIFNEYNVINKKLLNMKEQLQIACSKRINEDIKVQNGIIQAYERWENGCCPFDGTPYTVLFKKCKSCGINKKEAKGVISKCPTCNSDIFEKFINRSKVPQNQSKIQKGRYRPSFNKVCYACKVPDIPEATKRGTSKYYSGKPLAPVLQGHSGSWSFVANYVKRLNDESIEKALVSEWSFIKVNEFMKHIKKDIDDFKIDIKDNIENINDYDEIANKTKEIDNQINDINDFKSRLNIINDQIVNKENNIRIRENKLKNFMDK